MLRKAVHTFLRQAARSLRKFQLLKASFPVARSRGEAFGLKRNLEIINLRALAGQALRRRSIAKMYDSKI